MLQRQPSSPQSPVTASSGLRITKEKNTDHSSGRHPCKGPSFSDISGGRTPPPCPPWNEEAFFESKPKFHLVFAQPFFSTCLWISSSVSRETCGNALQPEMTSRATSLDKNKIIDLPNLYVFPQIPKLGLIMWTFGSLSVLALAGDSSQSSRSTRSSWSSWSSWGRIPWWHAPLN